MREMQMGEAKLDRLWLRDAAIASFVLSVFLGFIGPFGDYQTVSTGTRILAWTVLGMAGFAIYALILFALARIRPHWPWLLRQVLTVIFGTALLAPILSALDKIITGDPVSGWFVTYATVLPIGLFYLLVFEGLRITRQFAASDGNTTLDTPMMPVLDETAAGFMRRLPDTLEGELLCLSKEDHYLRVYTDQGDDLIRLRMSDAMIELEDMPGQQTHRSWWVADKAVVSASKRSTGGGNATLSNGLVVPIARARIPAAQQAGWFDR